MPKINNKAYIFKEEDGFRAYRSRNRRPETCVKYENKLQNLKDWLDKLGFEYPQIIFGMEARLCIQNARDLSREQLEQLLYS